MATHTTYYNLTKPAQNDKVNIGVLNDNADIIDTALHSKVDKDDLTADNVMMSDGVTSVEDAMLKAIEIPFNSFSWVEGNHRYQLANYVPTVNYLIGFIVTWTNGGTASIIYHDSSASVLNIGGLLPNGFITNAYQFKCYEIGF